MDRIQVSETHRLKVFALDVAGAGVTGATISLAIRKDSTGYWWSGSAFQASHTTVTMSETNSANLPGVYHYDFTPLETDFTAIFYATTVTAAVVNAPFVGDVSVGYWVDNLDAEVSTLATDADMEIVKSRLGTSLMDNELLRLRSILGQIQDTQKYILRTIEELKRR